MRLRFTIRNSLCLMLVVAAALTVVSRFSSFFQHDPRYNVPQIPFDAAAWKQVTGPQNATQSEGYRTIRSKMIEDLLKRYKFDGWTREQVVDLLGQPNDPGDSFDQWDIVYVLGLQRGGAFSLDWEALGFKFDSQGRVTSYHLAVQ